MPIAPTIPPVDAVPTPPASLGAPVRSAVRCRVQPGLPLPGGSGAACAETDANILSKRQAEAGRAARHDWIQAGTGGPVAERAYI